MMPSRLTRPERPFRGPQSLRTARDWVTYASVALFFSLAIALVIAESLAAAAWLLGYHRDESWPEVALAGTAVLLIAWTCTLVLMVRDPRMPFRALS